MDPQWLHWMKRLQSIASVGLAYCENDFDRHRYEEIAAIADEIAAHESGKDKALIHNLFRFEKGYPTPKVDARAFVLKDGAVLLVQEKADGDRWTLPGGWVDVGEPPSPAIEREVREEAGFEVKATRLLALYDRDHPRHGHPAHEFQIYKLYFLCELIGGEARSSIETSRVEFFRYEDIPEDLSIARTTRSQLDRLFELAADPSLATDFD